MVQRKIIKLRDFGIVPDTGEDCTRFIQMAVEMAKNYEASAIEFEPGAYHIYPEEAVKREYYITNTATKEENPDVTRTIGIHIVNGKNIILEGNGATLIYHGEMTTMVIDHSEDVIIQNLHIDFKRPTISEAVVSEISQDGTELVLTIHPDSDYEMREGQLFWSGRGWCKKHNQVQEYAPETDKTWRIDNFFDKASSITELAEHKLKLNFTEKMRAVVGHSYQFRQDIRTQVGVFITCSKKISFEQVGFHYMHGLGLTAQFSNTIIINDCRFAPREETKRTAAGFADFNHFVGCTGEIYIGNSFYSGSHDDCINVHGFHFDVMERPAPNQAVVRFMHPQSFGYQAFFIGDLVDFNDKETLLCIGSRTVIQVEKLNEYDTLLTFDGSSDLSNSLENASRYPRLTVEHCEFSRCPTRAILVSTREKVVIRNNLFRGMIMPSVFVPDDANYWYESG
ncbi:MAG: right-handed parallel beta-helix repeat-containing protein, partial [Herbinix sp.]|nr:right-handed parallel beta-helix repeat-containing protein [Herbinix sp.]